MFRRSNAPFSLVELSFLSFSLHNGFPFLASYCIPQHHTPLLQLHTFAASVKEMGARGCFGNIICCKKARGEPSHQENADSSGSSSDNGSKKLNKGKLQYVPEKPNEDLAATRIQSAFRAFQARRVVVTVGRLKGEAESDVHSNNRGQPVLEQISTTLHYMHSWSRIQSQIRARRICMVTEARIKQKKLENQLKFEAKLNKLEVEWCGESGTMEEILGRLQQREEAAVKRERALAYAFSHQWRANASEYLGQTSYYKNGWGWSWMQQWVSTRPWEVRVEIANSKKGKTCNGQVSHPDPDKSNEHSEPETLGSDKPGLCNLY